MNSDRAVRNLFCILVTMLCWTCHSLGAKSSTSEKLASDSYGASIDSAIKILQKARDEKEADTNESSLGNIFKLVNSMQEELRKLKENSSTANVPNEDTTDPYFDQVIELQDKLRYQLTDLSGSGMCLEVARELRLLLPILQDVIFPGISDMQADIQEQIENLIPLLDGFIEELQRGIADARVVCCTVSPNGILSQLSELNGSTPITKQSFLKICNGRTELVFMMDSDVVKKAVNDWETVLAKTFEDIKSTVPKHVAHSLLNTAAQLSKNIPKLVQNSEKLFIRKLETLLDGLSQLEADIKSQIDSSDTSENVKRYLKMHLKIIEQVSNRLTKHSKQFKDSVSSFIKLIESFNSPIQECIKNKPDD